MLFCSTVVGLPFLVPPMILTGELVKAWNSCSEVRTSPYLTDSFYLFNCVCVLYNFVAGIDDLIAVHFSSLCTAELRGLFSYSRLGIG